MARSSGINVVPAVEGQHNAAAQDESGGRAVPMAHIDSDKAEDVLAMAGQRAPGHVRRAQTMLLAAGIAAFGIVAVAGAMLTTLL